MHRAFITLSLVSVLAACPANADPMYELGRAACNTVLYEQEATFGEKYYLRYADLVDLDREELCECVGLGFVENADEQNTLMEAAGPDGETQALLKIVKRNLDSCLPKFDELDPAIQGMIMRGAPEGSHEMAEAQNALSENQGEDREADERLCRMIVGGEVESEHFDRDYLSNWEEQSELKVADMCGQCVVEMMQDRRHDLASEGLSLGTVNSELHSREVVGSMTECMHLTFRLPLN